MEATSGWMGLSVDIRPALGLLSANVCRGMAMPPPTELEGASSSPAMPLAQEASQGQCSQAAIASYVKPQAPQNARFMRPVHVPYSQKLV